MPKVCVAKKVSRTGLMVDFQWVTRIELGDGFENSVLGMHAYRLAKSPAAGSDRVV